MKLILSSILALTIGGLALPTQEPDEKKPQQEEPKAKPKPEEKPKSKPAKPPKQEPAPPPKQQGQEEKQQPDEKQRQQDQEKRQKEQARREQNRPPQQQVAPQNNRRQASGKGQRIPQEKFRASFGHEHHFRVARSGGGDNRRFQYSGYWFEVVEVWPAGWSFDDDCYIEEDGDDYYLVDVVHPEVRVLVIVVSA